MLFVLAAWACLLLAIVLAWLWLQRVPPLAHDTLHSTLVSHARATRMTLRTGALLLALSVVLLALHFVALAFEAAADSEWAAHANGTDGHAAQNTTSTNVWSQTEDI